MPRVARRDLRSATTLTGRGGGGSGNGAGSAAHERGGGGARALSSPSASESDDPGQKDHDLLAWTADDGKIVSLERRGSRGRRRLPERSSAAPSIDFGLRVALQSLDVFRTHLPPHFPLAPQV